MTTFNGSKKAKIKIFTKGFSRRLKTSKNNLGWNSFLESHYPTLQKCDMVIFLLEKGIKSRIFSQKPPLIFNDLCLDR